MILELGLLEDLNWRIVRHSSSIKICVIFLIESPFKIMKNAFYFILRRNQVNVLVHRQGSKKIVLVGCKSNCNRVVVVKKMIFCIADTEVTVIGLLLLRK